MCKQIKYVIAASSNPNLSVPVACPQIYDSFPMLRNLPLPFQKAFRNAELAQKMALKLVEQHKETRVPGEPRDFMDCYLEEMTKVGV